MKIEVIKRDGLEEDYDEGKIARVVAAAGLSSDQAQTLAAKITLWIADTQPAKVTSLQIRDKVIGELSKVNKYAANLFTWYEKTKESP